MAEASLHSGGLREQYDPFSAGRIAARPADNLPFGVVARSARIQQQIPSHPNVIPVTSPADSKYHTGLSGEHDDAGGEQECIRSRSARDLRGAAHRERGTEHKGLVNTSTRWPVLDTGPCPTRTRSAPGVGEAGDHPRRGSTFSCPDLPRLPASTAARR
ncbi:MAG: hypothetical protein JWM72_3193 [Actinomycetia bacterium]|nr:hypothetical protein [Actinomycetes bacterium]